MGKEARKLRMCFKDFTQHAFASEISHHIQKNTEQLKVRKCYVIGVTAQFQQLSPVINC